MERKLRNRFVLTAMLSLAIVMVLLFASINVADYIVLTKFQDNMLHSIADSGSRFPDVFPPTPFGSPNSPEAKSTTRFFSVRINPEGKIIDTSLDHVSSVDSDSARKYADIVKAKDKTCGYIGEYRYFVYQEGTDTIQIFLNCSNQLQFMKTLLRLSCLVSLLCFIMMFCLVLAMSKQAVKPYVRNIEIQKRFITDASHELKTPLTSISTSADILAYGDKDNEWIKNIQAQTIRLSRLVNELVTMSRLDEELPIPEKLDFSLSEALWESIEPFTAIAKANGKLFEQNIADGLSMRGDVVSIQQAISILLDNAIKYSDESGNIQICAYQKRQSIFIEVSNTCKDIDAKNMSRFFDRFYRGDQSRSNRISGTGVGLSIAKAIVRAHGGNISVKCLSGNTICFTIVL